MERVLGSLYRKASGKAGRWMGPALPPLAVPSDPQPGPGEVALAVRLHKKASGYIKARVREAGLVRSDEAAAWVGVLPAEVADDLANRVIANGGTVVRGEPA